MSFLFSNEASTTGMFSKSGVSALDKFSILKKKDELLKGNKVSVQMPYFDQKKIELKQPYQYKIRHFHPKHNEFTSPNSTKYTPSYKYIDKNNNKIIDWKKSIHISHSRLKNSNTSLNGNNSKNNNYNISNLSHDDELNTKNKGRINKNRTVKKASVFNNNKAKRIINSEKFAHKVKNVINMNKMTARKDFGTVNINNKNAIRVKRRLNTENLVINNTFRGLNIKYQGGVDLSNSIGEFGNRNNRHSASIIDNLNFNNTKILNHMNISQFNNYNISSVSNNKEKIAIRLNINSNKGNLTNFNNQVNSYSYINTTSNTKPEKNKLGNDNINNISIKEYNNDSSNLKSKIYTSKNNFINSNAANLNSFNNNISPFTSNINNMNNLTHSLNSFVLDSNIKESRERNKQISTINNQNQTNTSNNSNINYINNIKLSSNVTSTYENYNNDIKKNNTSLNAFKKTHIKNFFSDNIENLKTNNNNNNNLNEPNNARFGKNKSIITITNQGGVKKYIRKKQPDIKIKAPDFNKALSREKIESLTNKPVCAPQFSSVPLENKRKIHINFSKVIARKSNIKKLQEESNPSFDPNKCLDRINNYNRTVCYFFNGKNHENNKSSNTNDINGNKDMGTQENSTNNKRKYFVDYITNKSYYVNLEEDRTATMSNPNNINSFDKIKNKIMNIKYKLINKNDMKKEKSNQNTTNNDTESKVFKDNKKSSKSLLDVIDLKSKYYNNTKNSNNKTFTSNFFVQTLNKENKNYNNYYYDRVKEEERINNFLPSYLSASINKNSINNKSLLLNNYSNSKMYTHDELFQPFNKKCFNNFISYCEKKNLKLNAINTENTYISNTTNNAHNAETDIKGLRVLNKSSMKGVKKQMVKNFSYYNYNLDDIMKLKFKNIDSITYSSVKNNRNFSIYDSKSYKQFELSKS